MGAWGAGTFENDDASDWVWELEESRDDSVVRAALGAVNDAGEVEAPEACCALAAAEVVAAAGGAPARGLPESVAAWVAAHGAEAAPLHDDAVRAVRRVVERSELQELWAEADVPEWDAAVRDLLARLG